MNPAIHPTAEPDLGGVNSSFFTSESPETIAADTEGGSKSGFSYGIASVFALMLTLVVTLCVMLWVR